MNRVDRKFQTKMKHLSSKSAKTHKKKVHEEEQPDAAAKESPSKDTATETDAKDAAQNADHNPTDSQQEE